MPRIDPVTPPGDAVDEAKAYLRIDQDDEDALIASFIATAIRQCEGFTGQILLRRGFVQRLPVRSAWTRLSPTPVVAVTSVTGIPAEGAPFALPVGAYTVDIDSNSDGWVRVTAPGAAGRVDVAGTAGMASDWGGVPEALRQGVLRLVSHLHLVRDDPADLGPPAAVAALWRPWRRAPSRRPLTQLRLGRKLPSLRIPLPQEERGEEFSMTEEFTGALRERINIEQRNGGRDAIASATGTYRFDGAAWASVLPLNDAALVAGDALSAIPRWQVTMRKREGISQATRLWWRGRYLAVRGVACDPRVPGRMVLSTEEVR